MAASSWLESARNVVMPKLLVWAFNRVRRRDEGSDCRRRDLSAIGELFSRCPSSSSGRAHLTGVCTWDVRTDMLRHTIVMAVDRIVSGDCSDWMTS